MKHPMYASTLILSLCVFMAWLAVPAAAGEPPAKFPVFGQWHRLNPRPDGVSPEHEVWRLHREAASWKGKYYKQPEPKLGFENPPAWNVVHFTGLEVADHGDVICLDDVPFDCPGDVEQALDGTFKLVPEKGGPEYAFPGQLIVVEGEVLWHVVLVSKIVSGSPDFACPWFRSFEKALEANPFPQPFNGTDYPAYDCVLQLP